MKAIILFDGTCNFCNKYVNFIIDHDPNEYFQFASLQSPVGRQLIQPLRDQIKQIPDSIVLLKNGQYQLQSDAIIYIISKLSFPGNQLIAVLLRCMPIPVRNYVYNQFAKHRHRLFGSNISCRLPTDALKRRFIIAF